MQPTGVIAVYENSMLSGTFYLVQNITQIAVTSISGFTGTTSTNPFMDYFDDIANIMIISDTQIYWIHHGEDNVPRQGIFDYELNI